MNVERKPERTATGRRIMSRRCWLQGLGGGAALVTLVYFPSATLPTQDSRLLEAGRAMSAMTGIELSEYWLQQTMPLVGVILDYSRGLRQLDLGELEPVVSFVPR